MARRPQRPAGYHSSGLRLVLCSTLGMALVAAGAAGARKTRPPVSFLKSAAPLSAVESVRMPPVDVARLLAEDLLSDRALRPGPTRFAAAIAVDFDLENAGTWEQLDDGGRLWRLRIASPGALSVNLGFSRFDLPAGAGLWIYDPRGSHVEGPYTRRHRSRDGQLWTPVILGDEVVVEVHLPAGAGDARVELGSVNHGYRFFGEPPDKQGPCNVDVICPEVDPFRDLVRAVVRYLRSGAYLCTATLLNNTAGDFRPYLFTAEHCGISPANASSVVVYWNYESPTCGALSGGSLTDNQTGATFRASYQPSDFTLVELNQMPDPSSNVYYAGWDAGGAVPQSVVCIHHPRGDEKAAAFEGDALISATDGGVPAAGGTHWRVNAWDLGTTEPGSSGSCIFDQSTGRCLGDLTGGFASCSNPLGFDVYGKLSRSWTGGGTGSSRLSNWLDPVGGGATAFLDGTDPTGGGGGDCTPDATTLCLPGADRFQVTVYFETVQGAGNMGDAQAIPLDSLGTTAGGLFYFVNPDDPQFLVKVVNGCGVNGHYWVFYAATTNVGFELAVTDTASPLIPGVNPKVYSNPDVNAAPPVQDTQAFATCP